jgi:YD repeat-containing protein
MNLQRNIRVFIARLVVCLLAGISVYYFWPAQKSVTGATKGPNVAMQAPSPNIPATTERSALSENTTHSPQPPVNAGAPPVYKYNAQGQLTATIYADGSVCTYRYDAWGDKISETRPSGQTWTYLYDNSHKPLAVIDPKGVVTPIKASSGTAQ